MHQVVDLKVLYFGTPVVLISTRNPDGTANLAPMSSAWWLGDQAMLGMNTGSQTTRNLIRERECELLSAEPFGTGTRATAHTVRVSRAHVEEQLIVPGTQHIDPLGWQPLIMKFCEFFGDGPQVHTSRLARAWDIPQPVPAG